MESQRVDKLKTILEEIGNTADKQVVTKLEIEMCNRFIQRLSSFSSDCEVCYQHFITLENHIIQLKDKLDQLAENDFNYQKQTLATISSHLQKKHNLVSSGYYLSIYMSLGTSLGVVFGLLIFDNIGMGLPLGMGIGVAIGAGLDADAKKKGKTL
ncbi:hypothetical protein [Virgibacillus oceani]|uniref:Glycine zipper-like domain-containing protein n=1 Tax=Virgibacillus oceani TaxID=1479511 RepID=A0A917HK20_9BACI|nr:hypothetical protein [Virgibacillus oceani]GGG81194.1 hypothetical protein GCM10011398_28250 [Virgibacillus oceani]